MILYSSRDIEATSQEEADYQNINRMDTGISYENEINSPVPFPFPVGNGGTVSVNSGE